MGDKVRIHGFAYLIQEDSHTAVNMATVCDATDDRAPMAPTCDRMRRWITDEISARSCSWAKVENIAGEPETFSPPLRERWYYVSGCELSDFVRAYDQTLVKEADLGPLK